MKQTVNERIKLIREDSELNAAEFALKAGLSAPAIYKIESGESTPSQKTMRAISKAFGIDIDWIANGEGEMDAVVINNESPEGNPWKDALVTELKGEITYLREMLKLAVGGKKRNFLKALDVAGASFSKEAHSGARSAA